MFDTARASLMGYPATQKSNQRRLGGYPNSNRPCAFETLEGRCYLASQAYNWQNAPIGGGGFVTGIIYSPTVPNLVYARTDVGGAYRWDQGIGRWTALTDWATGDRNGGGVEAMAIDPNDSTRVYATLGIYAESWWPRNATFISSTDRGQTWTQISLPFKMGGNDDGRSNGERLMVDPNSSNILFLGTPDNGLWKSTNYGASWSQLTGFPVTTTADGVGTNFIQFIKSSGTAGSATPTVYAGVSQTGNNLYKSSDDGTTWQNISNASLNAAQMPQRSSLDGNGNMYITFGNSPGPSGMGNSDGSFNGSVWKLQLSSNTWTNVSPNTNGQGGFGGISVDAEHPGTLMVTNMDRWWPRGDIYRSTNGGTTWTSLRGTDKSYPSNLTDTSIWDGGNSDGLGWAGDIEIDPFNSNHAMIIDGGGIVSTFDLSSADNGLPTHWNYFVNGLEETVQLALVSPPSGAPLLTAAGDVAGERFTDLSAPSSNYSVLTGSNRSIDFAESNPNLLVRTGDVSPNIVYSRDNGVTWTAFPSLPANTGTGTGSIDNAGIAAMSADGNTVVWDPGDDTTNNLKFPLSYSTWNGSTWNSWTTSTWSGSTDVTPVADRLNANDFYILDGTKLYSSSNSGASWTLKSSSAPAGTLEATFAASGDLWISAGGSGLWHSTNFGSNWTRVASSTVTNCTNVGFGKAAPGQSYPAIYIVGAANSTTNIFRSDDGGSTWTTISDSQHQYAGAIVGDRNIYGRVYIGADARGIIYGDIQATAPSVVTAATANVGANSLTYNLSALGADDGGESNLTYTWRWINMPPGSTAPTFSVNGTNAAKNTVATFYQSGYYSFQVAMIDAQEHIIVSSVGVTVSVQIGAFTSALDIGSPSPAGSGSFNSSNNTYTVSGGGADIWNTSDQFQFLSESFSGDGVFISRVTSVQNTDAWAKGGVMFRDSTAANAMYADVVMAATSGVSFQWRNSTGGNCDYTVVYGPQAPDWVKLVRNGTSFTGFYATTTGTPSGSDWIQLGTAETIPMSTNAQAGLAVTSHNNGTGATATFTGVQIENFAVPSGSTLNVTLSSAGAVALSQSGANFTANQSGVAMSFTGITAIAVTDSGSGDVLNFNGPISLPFSFVSTASAKINVNTGTLTLANSSGGTLSIGSLSLGTSAALDGTNNKMLINYGTAADPIATIAGEVRTGFIAGSWNGPGIISSTARSRLTTALGYSDSADIGNPAGLTAGTIKVKYTWFGDANLDGKVDSSDYTRIDNGYLAHATGWDNGDFNYDGTVNGSDYTLIDNAFNMQGAQLATQTAGSANQSHGNSPKLRFSATPLAVVQSNNIADTSDDRHKKPTGAAAIFFSLQP